MAKSTIKRTSKPSFKPSSAPPPKSTPPTPHKYPFQPPSPALARFLATLPRGHIYILHTDVFSPRHKRLSFAVPLVLNLALTALLLWRAAYAVPAYFSILLATLGVPTPASVDIPAADWPHLMDLGARRTAMFFLDFTLVRFVAGWPWGFFRWWGVPVGPARWRWEVGVSAREVVVRQSRGWVDAGVAEEELVGDSPAATTSGSGIFAERVLPGVQKEWVDGRTGMAMLDKDWDLWYGGMVEAHRAVARGELDMGEFGGRTVAVWVEGRGGWLVWKLDGARDGGEAGEATRKVERVRARLGAMGKEALFWSWIDLVQWETEGRGGLVGEELMGQVEEEERRQRRRQRQGREEAEAQLGDQEIEASATEKGKPQTSAARKAETLRKGKSLFADHGVDFDAFWTGLGGVEGMPGLAA